MVFLRIMAGLLADFSVICKYKLLFLGNLAFKYNTSQGRSVVHFLICISI